LALDLEDKLRAAVALAGALNDLLAAGVAAGLAQRAGTEWLLLGEEGEDFGAFGDDGKVTGLFLGLDEGRLKVFALLFELFLFIFVQVVVVGSGHSNF